MGQKESYNSSNQEDGKDKLKISQPRRAGMRFRQIVRATATITVVTCIVVGNQPAKALSPTEKIFHAGFISI